MKTAKLMRFSLVLIPLLIPLLSCAGPSYEDEPDNTWKLIANPQELTASETFSRGVNFSGWFETDTAASIPYTTRYSERDFMYARSMGMDVIRLPIRMHSMTGGGGGYDLDPELLNFLDAAVDWAEKYKMFIILDNHSSYTSEEMLVAVWTQMARHFKNRSRLVVYEVLNEPNRIPAAVWKPIQGRVIDAIRAVDTTHAIVVDNKWGAIEPYSDPNLIYTFHFYEPFLFTHSGAGWASPSLFNLKELPFPGDAHAMPPVPNDLKGTQVEKSLKNYAANATEAKLAKDLDGLAEYGRKWNVKVFCGEFGAMLSANLQEDRVRYYRTVCKLLDERNIARTSWDFYGGSGFGVFKLNSWKNLYSDLNVELVRAMGFMAPDQKASQVVNTGFTIYDDYPGEHVDVNYEWWRNRDNFSLEDEDAAEGRRAIKWSNPTAYEEFYWVFLSTVDWKSLRDSDYAIRFKAKATLGNGASRPFAFDVRFVDRRIEESPSWRMRRRVTADLLPADGQWHTLTIPLKDMRESGAMDETWRDPDGKFDWGAIERLEFSWENNYGLDCDIWFDAIEIAK